MGLLRSLLGLSRSDRSTPPACDPLEARLALAADLALDVFGPIEGFNRRGVASLRVPAAVLNVGDAEFTGGGRVTFYYSADQEFGAGDVVLGETRLPGRLARGASADVKLETARPDLFDPVDESRRLAAGNYFVIGIITPDDAASDASADNNARITENQASVRYSFGDVSGARSVPLTITLRDGSKATFRLDGRGTGQLINDRGDGGVGIVLSVTGSEARTTLRAQGTRGPRFTLNRIEVQNPLKRLQVRDIDVVGNVDLPSRVASISLGKISDGEVLLGSGFPFVDVQFDHARNVAIRSEIGLKNVSATSWINAANIPSIEAPLIGTLAIGGAFTGTILLPGLGAGFPTLDKVDIKGAFAGTMVISGKAGPISLGDRSDAIIIVRGLLDGLKVRGQSGVDLFATNVRSVEVTGNAEGLEVHAGATFAGSTLNNLRAARGALTFSGGSIGRVIVGEALRRSSITAGVTSINGIFGDADDRFAGGIGRIDRIEVGRQIEDSTFAARTLPGTAKVNRRTVVTARDPRFITALG